MMYVVMSFGLVLFGSGFVGLLWNKNDITSAVSVVCMIAGYIMAFGAAIGVK
jgi:NADH:ubiquinone oxidoreductase subunit K